MAAAIYDFEIEQGTTINKPFVWKDSLGVPVTLIGYTARMQVRPTVSSTEVLLDATTLNGKIVLSTLGGVTLTLSALETAAITWRKGKYDIELVSATGIVTRLVQGEITVSPEVTRV